MCVCRPSTPPECRKLHATTGLLTPVTLYTSCAGIKIIASLHQSIKSRYCELDEGTYFCCLLVLDTEPHLFFLMKVLERFCPDSPLSE